MSAAGYAGERPLYAPSDPRAVTLNRRVEVIVLTTLPPAESALLPTAAPSSGLTPASTH
jgi:chemotaxis protein MotB